MSNQSGFYTSQDGKIKKIVPQSNYQQGMAVSLTVLQEVEQTPSDVVEEQIQQTTPSQNPNNK